MGSSAAKSMEPGSPVWTFCPIFGGWIHQWNPWSSSPKASKNFFFWGGGSPKSGGDQSVIFIVRLQNLKNKNPQKQPLGNGWRKKKHPPTKVGNHHPLRPLTHLAKPWNPFVPSTFPVDPYGLCWAGCQSPCERPQVDGTEGHFLKCQIHQKHGWILLSPDSFAFILFDVGLVFVDMFVDVSVSVCFLITIDMLSRQKGKPQSVFRNLKALECPNTLSILGQRDLITHHLHQGRYKWKHPQLVSISVTLSTTLLHLLMTRRWKERSRPESGDYGDF